MIDLVTQVVVWLNALANAAGGILLAPIGVLPGWLSATLIGLVTGLGLLAVFKYTSNQAAIKRVKDDIKANLLALKLFKENTAVAVRSQGAILIGAMRLFLFAIVPMLIMVVPVLLILGQLSLWYQSRPLRVGEDALISLKVTATGGGLPDVQIQPDDAFHISAGPVRVPSKQEVCWRITAAEPGNHHLLFHAGDQIAEKALAIGDHFLRVSALRPDWNVGDAFMYPAEKPFRQTSTIQSIAIDYPERDSWTSGADTWVVYWFIVSMASGFAFRRALNVNM